MKQLKLGQKVVSGAFIIYLILAALLNLIIFTVFKPGQLETGNMKLVFWFAYAFLMIAFITQFVSILTGRFEKGVEAAFFGFSLFSVSVFYFVITAALSVVFMVLVSLGVDVPFALMFVLECILLAFYLVAFIISLMHKNVVVEIDQKIKKNVRAIRAFVSDLECLADATQDAGLKTKLNALAEDFRYSDPMTNDAVAELDLQLSDAVAELEVLVTSADVATVEAKITQIKLTLSKRNRRLADSK